LFIFIYGISLKLITTEQFWYEKNKELQNKKVTKNVYHIKKLSMIINIILKFY
jgi:hypothetical protein